MAKENENDYFVLRELEYKLTAAITERDALKIQIDLLKDQLASAHERLDNAYARYHSISIAHLDLIDRAINHPKMSSVTQIQTQGKTILLLKDPVVRRLK